MDAKKPKMAPDVSIIVPTYGRKRYLAEAVASIVAQTHENWELIIVDDASPEPVSIDDFDDDRISIIRHDLNRGPGATRNTAAKAARGTWLAFLDDDDLWEPHRLEHVLEQVEGREEQICIVWSRVLGTDSDAIAGRRQLEGNCHAEIMTATIPNLGATMIRRDTFTPFDERYMACQDLEWWIRVSEHACVMTIPVPLFIWRRHSGPRNQNGIDNRIKYSQQLLMEHEAYFRAYPAAYAFRWFRLGCMLQKVRDYRAARTAFWRVVSGSGANAHIRASAAKRLIGVLFPALFLRHAKT